MYLCLCVCLYVSVSVCVSVRPPHPKNSADRQTSAGKFGANGEILEIWGEIFGQHRAIHWAL